MSVTKGPNAVSSPSRTRRKVLDFSLFIFSFFRCKNTSHIPLPSRPMPLGVVHFRNCTCANRSRALACGATGLRVSGWSVLRTVPEAFTPGPRFWGCGRGSALCGAGECCKEASHALRPILLHAGGEVLFARQGSVACGVLARRAGLVRGPRARRLERQVLLFPFVCACRVLASGCVLAKGKAGSGGGEKRQPEDRAAFGLSSRAGARYFVSRIRATMSCARARHGSHTACE